MKFRMYLYRNRAYQGNKDRAYIRVRVWGSETEQGEQKCKVKWKHETKRSLDT